MAEFDGVSRFNLSLAIMDLILRSGPKSLNELSEHFRVPESVIEQAVRAIILSEDGRQYVSFFDFDWSAWEEESIVDLRPNSSLVRQPTLGRHQATALAAGLDYLSTMPAFSNSDALEQLRSLFASTDVPAGKVVLQLPEGVLDVIRNAISTRVRIEFDYVNQGGSQSRRIAEPLRIDFRGGKHYLRAFCLTSDSLRSFRLDRITALEITDEAINPKNLDTEIPDEIFGNAEGGDAVKIKADISAREIFTNFPTNSAPVQAGSSLAGEIRIGNLNHLGRHIARYGGLVEVLEPESARAIVRQFVERALAGSEGE